MTDKKRPTKDGEIRNVLGEAIEGDHCSEDDVRRAVADFIENENHRRAVRGLDDLFDPNLNRAKIKNSLEEGDEGLQTLCSDLRYVCGNLLEPSEKKDFESKEKQRISDQTLQRFGLMKDDGTFHSPDVIFQTLHKLISMFVDKTDELITVDEDKLEVLLRGWRMPEGEITDFLKLLKVEIVTSDTIH